jgi:hypothetical protein
MATYIFELQGCTPKNLTGVQGSLVNVPSCAIYKTAQSAYLLHVQADTSPEGQLTAIFSSIGVTPIPAIEVKSILLG